MTNASYANYRYPFAGFWRRLLAHIIDVIAILLFLCFLAMVAAVILDLADISSAPIPAKQIEAIDAAAYLFFMAFWLLYRSVLESSPLQATIGKLALSIKVTDVAGQRISFLRAAARNLASL